MTVSARIFGPHGPLMTPPADPVTAPVAICDVCAHQQAAHDPIARRYCAATVAHALTRGCICAPHTG